MNRVLGLVKTDHILIAQSYPDQGNVEERLFALGSYLLIKGAHSYINLETSSLPEWFPEYDVALGPAVDALPTDISSDLATDGVTYQRRYARGIVLVNPTPDATTLDLDGVYQRAVPSGGGPVSAEGVPSGSLTFEAVAKLHLNPHTAAILMTSTD